MNRLEGLGTQLLTPIKKICDPKQTKVWVEWYSFGANMQGKHARVEFQGIVKYMLRQNGFKQIIQIPPLMWKKHFAHKGNADNFTIYQKWLDSGMPDLHPLLKCKIEDKKKDIRNPIQDIVDAYGLTNVTLAEKDFDGIVEKKKRGKKRKIQDTEK
jgi:hypothetical protein